MVYLQITLRIAAAQRAVAADVYAKYKAAFLDTIPGATSKQLLLRDADVQVLHGFDSEAHAQAYLTSALFTADVVRELTPLLDAAPDVRVYQTA